MASVLVCGGGNAAQVVSCLFGSRYKVTALSLYDDEAERWDKAVRTAGFMECTFQGSDKKVQSKPDSITKDPSAVQVCDVVLFTVPSSFHREYFEKLKPYVKDGTIFGVMPARSGCDFMFRQVMGDKTDKLGLVAFETLPWACRFVEWGKTATVLGTKETIGAAVVPPAGMTKMEVILKLQGLLGVQPMIVDCPNVMTISLGNPGQVIHPGVTYGKWKDWDEQPLQEKPLFYHGVDEATAEVLEGISRDIASICKALNSMEVDTSQVKTIFEWYMASYADSITDSTNLKTAMNSNTAYEGLCHPMKEVDGKYRPDFKFRYLSEDIPTGLCFTKGVAELLGVQTSTIDVVLKWSQGKLGKEFMTDANKMAGKDIGETRAPQAFNVTTRAQLKQFLSNETKASATKQSRRKPSTVSCMSCFH